MEELRRWRKSEAARMEKPAYVGGKQDNDRDSPTFVHLALPLPPLHSSSGRNERVLRNYEIIIPDRCSRQQPPPCSTACSGSRRACRHA
jgi:hypothetical protein